MNASAATQRFAGDKTEEAAVPLEKKRRKLSEPTKILGCKVCKATLEFIYTTVVGGESETSKKFLKVIGDAGVKACTYIKIDKVLGFLAKFLGKKSICEDVPALVNVLFKKVIAPFFKEKAPQTCGVSRP
ncbi:hypothetical protein OESDEN_02100 [Oesophagostomum dentatum]|uniref:Uncharacterized protein n=1 Tax=Oesophagostomum dentatum TaxID=61180 RepID=A0A0B1TKY4_OESDE|nr:hypothetical protein OESDEN_02100 [Oesophagostomum dentatum]